MLWRNLTNILKSFAIICNKLRARFIKLKKRTSLRTQNTIRQFILFGLVGFVNTIVHYVCYIVLLLTGVHYILSNIIAFSVGVISAYFFNHKYVFNQCIAQSRKFFLTAFLKTYLSYFFTGVILSNIILFYCVNIIGLSEIISPLVCLIFTVPINFTLNKYWSFRNN